MIRGKSVESLRNVSWDDKLEDRFGKQESFIRESLKIDSTFIRYISNQILLFDHTTQYKDFYKIDGNPNTVFEIEVEEVIE